MALQVGAQVNGIGAVSPHEEEELYAQLLHLEDAVLSGKHPQFKLPPAAIEQLKASLIALNASPVSGQPTANGLLNGAAFSANAATNHAQQSDASTVSMPGLPGLQARAPPALKPTSSGGLDPIFLEKSDSLVRAEGQLKRQRIERDLQSQVEQQRKHTRDKDPGIDAPSTIDVEAVLAQSQAREGHISGLKPTKAASAASSFDENDYYSSQVESDWPSPDSASKVSDRAADAFMADAELEGPRASFTKSAGKQPLRNQDHNVSADIDMYNLEDDDDDEYAPPDATAFDSFHDQSASVGMAHIVPEDEDSDYEPGEITQESNVPTPYHQGLQPAQPSPRVPVIRNHLTHIAAPQPNRVSPLAVAKRPSIELELVNGRPEVVHKARQNHHAIQSRASTASPVANGAPGSMKKRQKKNKRKREAEPSGRNKRKRDRHNAAPSPIATYQEPRIKDEPISPPPFSSVPDIPQYATRPTQYGVPEIDLVSPRYAPLPAGYAQEPPRSGLRYEYTQPASPAVVRAASPAAYRPVQRDTQDLRRVASLHHAQRAPSPPQSLHSPAAQRTVSMTYGDPRLSRASVAPVEAQPVRYADQAPPESARYLRQRSRSPPRLQEYYEPYARVQSPSMMPPPSAPPRRIVVDQYGNRYYAAEPAPAPEPVPMSARASVAPVDRRPTIDVGYERAPSRMATSYGQPPSSATQYEPPDNRMGPPPIPSRRQVAEEAPVQYLDTTGYSTREYSTRPAEQQVRYLETPTSPVYQAPPRYEAMPPPPQPMREPTSPVYAPPRSYSVRPEDPAPPAAAYTTRQASVAPVQYVREAPQAPVRAMSVAPGYDQPPARAYSYAPQPAPVRYVDQYGREVYPEVRQAPAPEYRYQ